jgi:hypothetical protein
MHVGDVKVVSNKERAGNPKTKKLSFNLKVNSVEGSEDCEMVYQDGKHTFKTYDLNYKNSDTILTDPYRFPCNEPEGKEQKDNWNGGFGPLNDLHHNLMLIKKMYKQLADVDFLNGGVVTIYGHMDEANAFWDGRNGVWGW